MKCNEKDPMIPAMIPKLTPVPGVHQRLDSEAPCGARQAH